MKIILSERELEIIKQEEYRRGWRDCVVNINKSLNINQNDSEDSEQINHEHQ